LGDAATDVPGLEATMTAVAAAELRLNVARRARPKRKMRFLMAADIGVDSGCLEHV
jgi:hypothetical protein